MKRSAVLGIALGLLLLSGCQPCDFKGYVVGKEYIPKHMSDESGKVFEEASLAFVPVVVPHRSAPTLIESEFLIYVANKYSVYKFRVDSLRYTKIKVGSKINTNTLY